MLYRYETHAHCAKGSACASAAVEALVREYAAAGFAGMVLTDHFIFGNTAVDRNLPWEQRMRQYWQAYLDGKAVAGELDFDLIFGLEHAYGGGKEFLLYGIDLDFLLANPDIPRLSVEELTNRVRAYGGVSVQAHPYRVRSYMSDDVPLRPDLADGIEVYNSGNHPGENVQALTLALEYGKFITCGGDIHHTGEERLGKAGIVLPYRVRDGKELACALKKGDHQYLVNGQLLAQIRPENLP